MKRSPIDRIIQPVNRFIHQEFTGGIVLFCSVIIAIIWANSPWKEIYHHIWEINLIIGSADYNLNYSLHTWINDGLMAIFFFVIGLELKREFMAGELSSPRKAILPMATALGGMLVPALIYYLTNKGLPSEGGWGIPMATDIAFSLGILSLAGKHIPNSVKVFLSALAVADDLGAVLVIAFFYSSNISLTALGIGGIFLLILAAGSLAGVRSLAFYLVIGSCVWACFLLSGVHATIAGVLVAFTIPARTKIDENHFLKEIKDLWHKFQEQVPMKSTLITHGQQRIIEQIKKVSSDAETPLQKVENNLHPWVALVIMPLFALANAGIPVGSDFFSSLTNPVSLGVAGGLLAGKFIGVLLFTWLMVKTGLAELPENATWRHITGLAFLAGVGFTMSLFITGLAFNNETLIDQAKYGILIASVLAGTAGILVLRRANTSA